VSIWTDLLGAQVHYVGTKYRTRVIECGDGEALILLHGGGGHAEAFSKNIVRLGLHFRVMAIDMLWHGLSSKPPFSGEPSRWYADQVIDVLDTLGIDRAHVEGEAIGGTVALYMGMHHGNRLGKLVLTNAGGVRFKEGSVEDRRTSTAQYRSAASAAIETTTRETVRKRFEQLFVTPAEVTDELVEVRYRFYSDRETNEAQAALRRHPNDNWEEEEVATIRTPTLVFVGDHVPMNGPDAGRRLAGLIPGATFHLLENSGIWAQWEQAEEHDRIVTDFLMS
jgi:pimeloyl-ACP methyl ester carboxylesterase